MYENFSNFCRVMLAHENVQLFKLKKQTSVEESRARLCPSKQLRQFGAKQISFLFLLKALPFSLGQT